MASPRARFSLKKALSESWQLSKKNFWFLVGITLLFLVLNGIGGIFDVFPGGIKAFNSFFTFLITPITATGLFLISLSIVNGQRTTVATFFGGFRFYWRALGLILLMAIMVVAGLIFFIVPGIYLAIRYSQSLYILIDQDVSISEAMRRSSRLTEDNIWALFGSRLLIGVIAIAGFILIGIGIFWTFPIAILAQISIYLQLRDSIKGKEDSTTSASS